MNKSHHYLLVLFLFVLGCSSADKRVAPGEALPFSVRVQPIQVDYQLDYADPPPDAASSGDAWSEDGTGPQTPANFHQEGKLTEEFTKLIADAGIFTRVVSADDKKTAVDLELEIEILGSDFGEGNAPTGSAIFSTFIWLLAGHASWFIDNREYPDSEVRMQVFLRPTRSGRGDQQVVFADEVQVKGLQLNFLERSEGGQWLSNILIPPSWGASDGEKAGDNLSKQVPAFFAQNEPERMLSSLPTSYFLKASKYLVYNPNSKEVIIVSQEQIRKIAIKPAGRKRRLLDDPDLVPLLEVDGPEREDVRLSLAGRLGIFTPNVTDRYYRVPLLDSEVGFVRVQVAPADHRLARWTIFCPSPEQVQ